MKLRLTEDTLRLRLSPEEATALRETGRIQTAVWLDAGSRPWTYSLEILSSLPRGEVVLEPQSLGVRIPRNEALPWLGGGKPGITLEIPTGGPALRVIVETDLRP